MKISYGITVHDEAEELKRLLNILIEKIDKDDEIIICVDGEDDAVKFELDVFTQTYHKQNLILVYQRKLDGDFAAHKNSVIENSRGDYIFHFDADEYPHDILLQQVKPILDFVCDRFV